MSKNETIILGFSILWFIPFLLVMFSNKTQGGEKLLWTVLSLFGSWFTFGFYSLVAPLHGEDAK